MTCKSMFWKACCAVLLCAASANVWSAPGSAGSDSALEHAMDGTGAETALRQTLGAEYAAFRRNFEVAANPVALKDGGMFLDGWRADAPDTQAAAFVFYPNGDLHAAYYDADAGEVFYFSNSNARIHPAIQVWAKRFGPTFRHRSTTRGQLPEGGSEIQPLSGAPTADEQVEMRKVANAIWGESIAGGWDMNADVGDILGNATKEIMDCSEAFSLVPKPLGWVPGWSYVAKTSLQIVNYITGVSASRVYSICVGTTARNWRSAIELASIGI